MSNRAKTSAQRRSADANNFSLGGGSSSGNGVSIAHNNNLHRKSGSRRQLSPSNHSGHVASGGDGVDLCAATAKSSLLQPRMAVVLGLSKIWHPLLFVCRLLSIGPAVWWGLPSGLRLVVMLHLLLSNTQTKLQSRDPVAGGAGAALASGNMASASVTATAAGLGPLDVSFEARLRLIEALLATVWCGASGYLSFFFTDCLMSRWLLNYTPQATLIRLLTISAINAYLTSCALSATGASADPRLLLPAWVAISTTLTAMYHVTQRKINIRKETSMSMSVFSIASFISMVMLLWLVHSNRTDYPDIPLVLVARRAWREMVKIALAISDYGNTTGYIFR